MINLLPPESTKQLRAARHNTLLMKYVMGLAITLGLIVLVYGSTFVLMKSTELASSASSEASKQKIATYNKAAAEAKDYTTNLRMAKTIFDSELSHTSALHKIAAALPNGTVLETLNLSPALTSQPTTLTILAKTKPNALDVKKSLEEHKIASGITIASLTENKPTGEDANKDYPITLGLNLTFDKTLFTPEKHDE